jgi:single-stranded DNA-specific DHH superfamily exonuclease
MGATVVFHGDCDGVIAAYLYIKKFLRDLYPSHINLVVTHPWRAHVDLQKAQPGSELIVLDIALNDRISSAIASISTRHPKVVVVDHHATSEPFVGRIQNYARVIYSKSTSTPRLLAQYFSMPLNPYESLLVDVADVCEGEAPPSTDDRSALEVVDSIRMSVAFNPGDVEFMRHLIDLMMKTKNIHQDEVVRTRARRAKLLLSGLLRVISEDSVDFGRLKLSFLSLPVSRAFAGLIGVAATELSKAYRKTVVLVREEQDKVVITVRSAERWALELSKAISESLGGVYGGHAEASSITLGKEPLEVVVGKLIKLIEPLITNLRAPKLGALK